MPDGSTGNKKSSNDLKSLFLATTNAIHPASEQVISENVQPIEIRTRQVLKVPCIKNLRREQRSNHDDLCSRESEV